MKITPVTLRHTFSTRDWIVQTTALYFFSSSLFVKAADKYWVPTLSSNWGTATSWDLAGFPGSYDRAIIQNGGTCVIPAGTSASAALLRMGGTDFVGKLLRNGSILQIQAGGSLTTLGHNTLGYTRESTTTVAGTWNSGSQLSIGYQSGAILQIQAAGIVNSTSVNLNHYSSVDVNGTWAINALYGGSGDVKINSAGLLTTAAYSPLGDQYGADCSVAVNQGGIWNSSTDINLGVVGTGRLLITGTGRVNVNGGVGTVNLSSSSSGSGVLAFGDGTNAGPGILSTAKIVGKNSLTQGWANVWLNHGGSYTLATPLQGNLRVTKDNSGTTTISGNNSYTGITEINKGTIKLGSAAALGANSGELHLSENGILDLAGFNLTKQVLFSYRMIGIPTIHSSVPGAVKLTISKDLDPNQNYAYGGRIDDGNGVVSLEKVSDETLTLSGPSNFSGGTNIRGGLLILGGNTSAGTGPITIFSGALRLMPGVTIANPVVLAGGGIELGMATGESLADRSLASSEQAGSVSAAALLGGTLSTPATLAARYSVISTASNDTSRTSQILTLTGLPKINGSTSQTDTFVLQMSGTEASGPIHLGWFEPGSNKWVSAVSGNIGGTPVFAGDRPYNAATDFVLGLHGYDSASRSAWAVINHNSQFSIQRGNPGVTTRVVFNAAVTAAGLTALDAIPTATPFNDDVENLLKFAFNMNLSSADVHKIAAGGNSGLPLIHPVPNGLRFEYVRRIGSDLIYSPQWSSSLAEGSFIPVSGIPIISAVDSMWERVVVTQAVDPGAVPRCFGIVVVTLP